MSPEELAGQQANRAALVMYGGQTMNDPKLLRRLKRVRVPVLVAWGEHDGVVTVDYGRAFANAFRSARFVPIAKAAHFPQLEQPELLVGLVRDFATAA